MAAGDEEEKVGKGGISVIAHQRLGFKMNDRDKGLPLRPRWLCPSSRRPSPADKAWPAGAAMLSISPTLRPLEQGLAHRTSILSRSPRAAIPADAAIGLFSPLRRDKIRAKRNAGSATSSTKRRLLTAMLSDPNEHTSPFVRKGDFKAEKEEKKEYPWEWRVKKRAIHFFFWCPVLQSPAFSVGKIVAAAMFVIKRASSGQGAKKYRRDGWRASFLFPAWGQWSDAVGKGILVARRSKEFGGCGWRRTFFMRGSANVSGRPTNLWLIGNICQRRTKRHH
jgi:hypothetical protein